MPDCPSGNAPDLEQAFLEIADLPAAERDQRLETLPVGVRSALRQMIDADASAHDLFADAITSLASDARGAVPGAYETGSRIGPYRILRVLGHGGMGTVYEAARHDGQFEQRAAIKMVEGGAGLLPKFQRERQILARLSHPNIARLLDGGSTEDGTPYFVMELVEQARPIDAICAGMDPKSIARLFLPVFRALEYVHSNLVVHGDLKASNVLVDGAGTPKLLDFGIARILGDEAEQTRTVALTLSYASPEQVLGQPLTTATDVYGLASLLYRSLTGRTALDVGNRPLAEAVTLICNQEPALALDYNPAVGVDLSRILAKALRKVPSERYSSIEAFRADLEAYLDGRPVEARGSGALYRAGKFARRHWAVLAGAALIVAIASAAFVSVTRSAERAEEQRAGADKQRLAADAARQQEQEQRKLAENALRDAQQSRKVAEGKSAEAVSERHIAHERLQSERHFTDVFTRLVDDNFLFGTKDSVRILDGWIDTQEQALQTNPRDLAIKRLVGFLHYRRCAAKARTNLRSGESDCNRAVELLAGFIAGIATEDWILRTHMSANLLLGQIYAGTQRIPDAIRLSTRAVELADLFPTEDFAGYRYRVVSRAALANVYFAAGRFDEAIRKQEEAHAIWNSRPKDAEITGEMAVALPAMMQRYAQMLLRKDPPKAEAQMRRAITIFGELAARKTAGCLEVNEYANALNMTPFESQRNPDVSLVYARKAVEVCPEDRRPLAMDTLAWAHFRKGETAKATEVEKQAVQLLPAGPSPMRFTLQSSLQQFEKAASRIETRPQ